MSTPLLTGEGPRRLRGTETIVRPHPTSTSSAALAMVPGPDRAHAEGIGPQADLVVQGRASLVGSTKRNMILGYAIGA